MESSRSTELASTPGNFLVARINWKANLDICVCNGERPAKQEQAIAVDYVASLYAEVAARVDSSVCEACDGALLRCIFAYRAG